jgi:hypothetical protein
MIPIEKSKKEKRRGKLVHEKLDLNQEEKRDSISVHFAVRTEPFILNGGFGVFLSSQGCQIFVGA